MAVKICKLVQHHSFLDARIFKKEAKSLAKAGYDVTVVAPRIKGYLIDIDGTPFTDRYLASTFVHEGVRVVTYADRRDSLDVILANVFADRCASLDTNYLSKAGFAQQADVYHAHEFLSLYAGYCIKREWRARGKSVKLVYDSHEVTPDPFAPISPERKKKLRTALVEMLKEVDHVIAVSDSMKAWYLSINPKLTIDVIYNSPPLSPFYVPKTYAQPHLTMGYEGNMGADRGSFAKACMITEAANRSMDLRFKIIGGARAGQSVTVPPAVASKLTMTGWVDYGLLPAFLADVDVGWIDSNLPYSLNHAYALPNKLFSYLNAGLPVIVNKCHEMEELIRKHRCGLVIDKPFANAADYVYALLYVNQRRPLLQRMSANARRAMEEIYAWEHMEKRLLDVYRNLVRPVKLRFIF